MDCQVDFRATCKMIAVACLFFQLLTCYPLNGSIGRAKSNLGKTGLKDEIIAKQNRSIGISQAFVMEIMCNHGIKA